MNRSSIWRNYNKPYVANRSIEWIQSGEKYFNRIAEIIASAQNEIHLQTYIFNADATGIKIGNALIDAAKRGVRVYVLIDAYGSQGMSSQFQQTMESSGIEIRKYGALFSRRRFHIARRLHSKVLVIDGKTSVVGGINISDQYAGTDKKPAWLDFAAIVTGATSFRLELICRKKWKLIHFPKKTKPEIPESTDNSSSQIRVRRNDFIRNQNEIAISYRQAIRQAEKSLLFVGGYFLPGGRTRRMLKTAVKRGVEVSILVAEKSDVGIMVNARRYLYNWLTKNGIRVYEYRPSNVHGKVLILDEKWCSIGSYDLNNLSTFSNIELNLDIANSEFSKSLSNHIHRIMNDESTEITLHSTLLQRNILIRFRCWIAYRFVKILFVLAFVLARKNEEKNKAK